MLIQLYYLAEKIKNINNFVVYIEYEIKKFLLCSNTKSNVLLTNHIFAFMSSSNYLLAEGATKIGEALCELKMLTNLTLNLR